MRLILSTAPFVLALLLAGQACQAGAIRGPVREVKTVSGFHVMTVNLKFRPGEEAVLSIAGDGDTDLAVSVLDTTGQKVAVQTRPTDRYSFRWKASGTGVYVIKIYNRGGVPNRFLLRTN